MGNSNSSSGRKETITPTARLDYKIGGVQYIVEYESDPFDSGACRHAFKGVYKGDGPLNNKKCVTKVFKEEINRNYKNYMPDVKASQKAREFAEAFNADYASSSRKPLMFIVPEMATVTRIPEGTSYAKVGDKILVEDFIEGQYEKFNSNGGFERRDVAAIPAFSHYTYWKSNGKLLVCDIQGVRTPTGYTLTDPAVLSRQQGQFGPTDIGPVGMTEFFKEHTCGSVCCEFPRPELCSERRINVSRSRRRETTYTFMLDANQQDANAFFKNRNDLPAIMEE